MKIPFSFSLSKLPLSRNWLTLAGALTMGGIAVFLSNKLLHDYKAKIDAQVRAAHTMVKVVVAKRDLERGSPIVVENFSLREIPAEYVHASALRPKRSVMAECKIRSPPGSSSSSYPASRISAGTTESTIVSRVTSRAPGRDVSQAFRDRTNAFNRWN